MDAPLPAGCSRTVYLCDDGKNKQKRKWCLGRAPEVVYVSGRQRPKGEMNGKSANLNNCLRQIYPESAPVPANEIVCIFDADQVQAALLSQSLSPVASTCGMISQCQMPELLRCSVLDTFSSCCAQDLVTQLTSAGHAGCQPRLLPEDGPADGWRG